MSPNEHSMIAIERAAVTSATESWFQGCHARISFGFGTKAGEQLIKHEELDCYFTTTEMKEF